MFETRFKRQAEEIFGHADIRVGGDRPWDLRIHNNAFFKRVLMQGSLGLGEAYMDGWWDSPRLDELFYRIAKAGLNETRRSWASSFGRIRSRIQNLQRVSRAFHIGKHHYDAGNDLYRRMLGERMLYSCGYWRRAQSLEEAQEAKLDLIFRKIRLEKGMRVLDVGCGWGGAAQYAAERYGVEVVGITVSEEQVTLAREKCRGLPVEIRLQDYRSLDETFDRIYSIGMFEHVGVKNYATFMRVVRRCLASDGLFALHTIGGNRSVTDIDPWIARYIFPNSMLPSVRQIAQASEGLFVVEDWHNFGADYDKTLMEWQRNFEANWEALRERYDERFRRMWNYYLLSCAAFFRARIHQLWQIVLAGQGVPGGYVADR